MTDQGFKADEGAAASLAASASADEQKGTRVYIGNLSWGVSWQDLKDHMKSTGLDVVHATIMTAHDGRSKGCGIVEFATPTDAAQAVLTLNDTELKGRQIFVREDREAKKSSSTFPGAASTGSASGGHRISAGEQSQRVYVGNLAYDVSWQDLKDVAKPVGRVAHVEIMTDKYTGKSKGCGIIEFYTAEDASNAITSLTGTELKGRTIFVREDRETESKTSGGQVGLRDSSPSVYVWNLATETSWQDLKDHMRRAGNVDSATIFSNSNEDFNSGIIVYQRPQDATRAIRELQGTVLHGRPLNLREDRMPGSSGGGGRGSAGRGAGRGRGGRGGEGRGRGEYRSEAGTRVDVMNLSNETTWRELKDHFRQCGFVSRAEVLKPLHGGPTCTGTVSFTSQDDAEAAVEALNGSELQGSKLEVRLH